MAHWAGLWCRASCNLYFLGGLYRRPGLSAALSCPQSSKNGSTSAGASHHALPRSLVLTPPRQVVRYPMPSQRITVTHEQDRDRPLHRPAPQAGVEVWQLAPRSTRISGPTPIP